MKIPAARLATHLSEGLKPVYLVSGEEPLQLQEAVAQIRACAVEADYSERTVFHVERGFNWGELDMQRQSLSLFAEKKVVELRVGSGKVGTGSKHLLAWAEDIPEDCLLIVVGDRFERAVLKSSWYQTLSAAGVAVEVKPVEARMLPKWLAGRVQAAGLEAQPDALETLAELVEGNLLAAVQEIEKMVLLYGPGTLLDRQKVLAAVADSARFELFDLTRALQRRDVDHYLRILAGLKEEGVEATLIIWLLAREIRQMQGRRSSWLRRAAAIDRTLKGVDPGNVWDQLQDLGRTMCGLPVYS